MDRGGSRETRGEHKELTILCPDTRRKRFYISLGSLLLQRQPGETIDLLRGMKMRLISKRNNLTHPGLLVAEYTEYSVRFLVFTEIQNKISARDGRGAHPPQWCVAMLQGIQNDLF